MRTEDGARRGERPRTKPHRWQGLAPGAGGGSPRVLRGGRLYCSPSWMGGFIFMVVFFSICLFFVVGGVGLCFFCLFFFLLVSLLRVCLFCLSGQAGSRQGRLARSNFPLKTWAEAGSAAPWDSRDEGAGRGKKSFLSQIPGLGAQWGCTERGERERKMGVRLPPWTALATARCPRLPGTPVSRVPDVS